MDIRSFFSAKGPKKKPKKQATNAVEKPEIKGPAEKPPSKSKSASKPKKPKRKRLRKKEKEEDEEAEVDIPPSSPEGGCTKIKRRNKENGEQIPTRGRKKKQKRTKKVILSDDESDDDDFQLQPPKKKSPAKKSPAKSRVSKKSKKRTPEKVVMLDPSDFFGSPSAKKETKAQVTKKSVEEEELELATALSLSEQDSSKILKNTTENPTSEDMMVEEAKATSSKEVAVKSPIVKLEPDTVSTKPASVKRRASMPIQDKKESGSSADIEAPSTKKRKWYPGMSRTAPPNAGSKEIPEGKPNCLLGLTFVITGTMDSLEREEAEDLIKRYGGRVTSAVSGRTSFLIVGTDAGKSKTEKAIEKGVKHVDEDFLLKLIKTRESGSAPKPKTKVKKPSPAKSSKMEIRSVASNADPNQPEQLWVDKYKPMTTRHLIGNQSNVKQLTDFLKKWNAALKNKTVSKLKHRAVLLAGNAGLGKSTAATVVCRELGFTLVEFNASDVRSKKSLENEVVSIAFNRGITEFMYGGKKKGTGRTVLVMDEVDGMSGNADRGGMKLLMAVIKKSKVPIICICNDSSSPKMRSLKNNCLLLKFRRPTAAQIAPRITEILRSEGLVVERNALDAVVEATRGDIRQILNLCQMWRKKKTNLKYMEVKGKLGKSNCKDFDLGPFDVISKVFNSDYKPGWVIRKSDYFFVDFSLMPLMVEENYLSIHRWPNNPFSDPNHRKDIQNLEALDAAAMSFSDGDLASTQLRRTNNWGLLPYHAMFTCVIPGSVYAGNLGRPSFPQWLGKFSSRNKNKRFFNLLKTNMSVDSQSNSKDLALDQISELSGQLSRPLIQEKDEGIAVVIDLLDKYSLDRNDWDMVMELGQRFGRSLDLKKIPSKVKAAFTRRYNSEGHSLKVARKDLKAVRKKAQKDAKVEAGEQVENGESDDDGLGAMIKQKKRKASKGKKVQKKKKKGKSK